MQIPTYTHAPKPSTSSTHRAHTSDDTHASFEASTSLGNRSKRRLADWHRKPFVGDGRATCGCWTPLREPGVVFQPFRFQTGKWVFNVWRASSCRRLCFFQTEESFQDGVYIVSGIMGRTQFISTAWGRLFPWAGDPSIPNATGLPHAFFFCRRWSGLRWWRVVWWI